MKPRVLVRAALGAACYFALLLPWPGSRGATAAFFRAEGAAFAAVAPSSWLVRFRSAVGWPRPVDTEIVLADRRQLGPDGSGPGRRLGLDSRGIGWAPTVLFLALAIAGPAPRGPRWRVALCGVALVQTYVFAGVAAFVADEAAQIGLLHPPAWARAVIGAVSRTVVFQLGAGFVAPAAIYLVLLQTGGGWANFGPAAGNPSTGAARPG